MYFALILSFQNIAIFIEVSYATGGLLKLSKDLLYFEIINKPVENYLEFRLYGVSLDPLEDFLCRLDHVGVGGFLLLANVDHNHLSKRKKVVLKVCTKN